MFIIEGSFRNLYFNSLIYLKEINSTFQRLNELPIELAKGHFVMLKKKNKYLGKFGRGMSQLKIPLDVLAEDN